MKVNVGDVFQWDDSKTSIYIITEIFDNGQRAKLDNYVSKQKSDQSYHINYFLDNNIWKRIKRGKSENIYPIWW